MTDGNGKASKRARREAWLRRKGRGLEELAELEELEAADSPELTDLEHGEFEGLMRERRLRDSQWALAAHKAAIETVKSGLSLWALVVGIALLCGARWSLLWCSVAVVAALATGAGGVSWHLEKRFGVKVRKDGVVVPMEADEDAD